MRVYSQKVVQRIRALRQEGFTYREINEALSMTLPKSTLSYLCKGVDPGGDYQERMKTEATERLAFIRTLAVKKNKQIFEGRLTQMAADSQYALKLIHEPQIAKIALAMLYLGEGAKWQSRRGLQLGSSDSKILRIYINLLKECYGLKESVMRCRIQHRADQNGQKLLTYWSNATGIPKRQFYPNYIDRRTVGKVTKKTTYKGVCVVTCPGTHIQLELGVIADIISGAWGIGAVG